MVHLGNSWDELLKEEWKKPYYLKLRQDLIHEYRTRRIYPAPDDIFNALKSVDYDDVKVVILGQDPYHGPNQAHGYSFSVRPGVAIPPSLQNIYKELHDDLGIPIPHTGCLLDWANQGVLLLNATLTVRAGQANSHSEIGWRILTDRILQILNEREKPMVFFLWGAFARSKRQWIDDSKHLVIESPHPSPLSAYRGFFGSRPFSKANKFLEEHGMTPVDWRIHE